jgi:hypothetical protein
MHLVRSTTNKLPTIARSKSLQAPHNPGACGPNSATIQHELTLIQTITADPAGHCVSLQAGRDVSVLGVHVRGLWLSTATGVGGSLVQALRVPGVMTPSTAPKLHGPWQRGL